jgi:hypothetical protein
MYFLHKNSTRACYGGQGEVVVFLDSHCEVGRGWLTPLLATIQDGGRKVVVAPTIDNIDYDSLRVEAVSSYLRGGFDWRLDFFWEWITASDRAKRIRQMSLSDCAERHF